MLIRLRVFRITALGVLTALALAACKSENSTGPSGGPQGAFVGTLVGTGVSGVLTLNFPGAAASAPARQVPAGMTPAANAAAAPISITGTLAIVAGATINLNGTYDPSANPQLTVIGGGYTITGNYSASNSQFSGNFAGPSGSGQWTVAAGGTTVRVFCGTYSGSFSGTWNLVLDASNHLFGVASTPAGAVQLLGSYSPGSNPNVSLTFSGGSASGSLDPSTAVGSGTWSTTDGKSTGTWTVNPAGCSRLPPPPTAKLFGVKAVDPSTAFAVGEEGTILSYNTTSWSLRASGTTDTLYSVGPDLFVVGVGGTILKYNPTSGAWSPQTSPTTNALYGVTRGIPGAASGALFAVGAAGTILYYNTTSWSSVSGVPTTSTLYGVAKVPGFPYAFAVGAGGTILFFDGTGWVTQNGGTMKDLYFVGVTSYADPSYGTNVYALGAGGTILHYDGTTWTTQTSGTTNALRGGSAGGAAAGRLLEWAVGDAGLILHSSDGSTWSPQQSGTTDDLTGVSAALPNDVFAVGDKGTILHYNGTGWTKQR